MDRMAARPACQRGVQIPAPVGNLTDPDNKAAAEAFAEAAQKLLQR
jgi:hypothetical protein